MAGDIDELKRAVEGLRSEIKSFLATYNSNNVEIRQGLIGSERWQAAHERLDEERWEGIKEKLHELKGMLETVPLKVNEDIKAIRKTVDENEFKINTYVEAVEKKTDEHGATLTTLKGVWLALSVGSPALFALIEYLMHGKG